jgi:predicted DNA-binding transcriptional regulator YafY
MQNNVIRILTFLRILQQHSDEQHPLKRGAIEAMMGEHGFTLNRKTFYEYVRQLRVMGYTIEMVSKGARGYYLKSEPFSFAQAKLLVDAIQTSRAIEKATSTQLISKITSLMSLYEASQLKRKLYLQERPKTFNKNIYATIDNIHAAIFSKKKIAFRYHDVVLNYKNELDRRYRHDGKEYIVSPYSLVWADDNYYLVAHYDSREGITHFRVDRMDKVMMLQEPSTTILEATNQANFDLAKYSQQLFSMFAGELQAVELLFDEDLLQGMVDRFGKHATYERVGNQIKLTSLLAVSAPFFAWVFQYQNKVKIIGPQDVVASYQAHLEATLKLYQEVPS